jgi:Lar family restriction alleviation protein
MEQIVDDLKPCPFCGGDAEIDTQRGYRALANGDIHSAVAIYCMTCSADMAVDPREVCAEIEAVKADLVALWNSRS